MKPTEHFAETVFADPDEGLRFVVRSGPHAGAALGVGLPLAEPMSIGSHLDCSLVLAGGALSALHALVFERDEMLWLSRVPGGGEITADGRPLGDSPVRLVRGMSLLLAQVEFVVTGAALGESGGIPSAAGGSVVSRPRARSRAGVSRLLASGLCVLGGVLLIALSLGTPGPAGSKPVARAAIDRPAASARSADAGGADTSLAAAAEQVARYIGDPGVTAVASAPGRIDLKGTARSANTRLQIEKIGKALPAGVVLSSAVSYPKDETSVTAHPPSEPLSTLARKVLQVAASERVPYIEIEGGERVFEGGQLNGYELLKIAPGEIVVRRDGLLRSIKVE